MVVFVICDIQKISELRNGKLDNRIPLSAEKKEVRNDFLF